MKLDPNYVTGLTEGEGTFTYGLDARGARPRFALKLIDKDRALVEAVRDFFQVGAVYAVKGDKASGGNRSNGFIYSVTKRTDLNRIVAHFIAYPCLGKKHESFLVWTKLLSLKQTGGPRGLQIAAARELSALSTKGAPALR